MATITKRKTGAWQARVRRQGYPEQIKTFDRKRDAEDWSRKIETAMKSGTFDATTESRTNTVSDMIDRLNEENKNTDRDKTSAQLEWWREQLGDYAVAAVNPKVIDAARQKLYKRRNRYGQPISESTVNRYLAALSTAFTAAIEWHWLSEHPMTNKKIRRKTEARGRVRFLSDEERRALLDACEGELHTIVVLALSTGMRRGEIKSLRWSDVDLKNRRVILRDTKNKDTRAAFLSGEALALMQKRPRPLRDQYVFVGRGMRPYDFDHDFREAVKRARLEDFKFHDLRHTAASYLAMSGATLAEISAILGHKTLAMVKRYAHLAEDHQSRAVDRMVDKMLS